MRSGGRSNIGNGRLYGLEEDLGLRGDQFQTATSVFFATYVVSILSISFRLLPGVRSHRAPGVRSPFHHLFEEATSCTIHQRHSSTLGNHRHFNRVDSKLCKPARLSAAFGLGGRAIIPLSDRLLDDVLYEERAGGPLQLPTRRCSNRGCRGRPRGLRSRVHGRPPRVAWMAMVSLHHPSVSQHKQTPPIDYGAGFSSSKASHPSALASSDGFSSRTPLNPRGTFHPQNGNCSSCVSRATSGKPRCPRLKCCTRPTWWPR